MSEQPSHLLLILKSLTQNRKEKKYLITIQNHNTHNPLSIENQFTHNYQYVYKLWPCQAAQRQLIKITIFEKLSKGAQSTLVKRAEASPLLRYSQQGKRFQFYGSFDQKCVLVLIFKVDNRSKGQGGGLQRMNSGSSDGQLQSNKDQSLSYKNYLEQTNRFIQNISEKPHKAKEDSLFHSDNKNKIEVSLFNLKYKHRNQAELSQQRLKKTPNINTFDKAHTALKILSKDKYLNSSLELNAGYCSSERNSSPQLKQQIKQSKVQVEEKEIEEQLQLQSSRMEMSRHIKKRRQKYLGRQLECNSKQPLESEQNNYQIDLIQSFGNRPDQKQPENVEVKEQCKKYMNNSKASTQQQTTINPLIMSKAKKKDETKQHHSSNLDFIRTEHFPAKSQKIAEVKLQGFIRRKTTNNRSESGIQPTIEQQVSINNYNKKQQFEPNITHYSIHSKIDGVQQDSYNISLFKFKAILYAGNKTHSKKLVIIFQDSKYSTRVNNCVSLTTEWHQRFAIRSCKKHSYIYFKLISVAQKQRQQGQSQVIANDIFNSASKVYRSYIFCDNLAIGYLQFEFEFNRIANASEGWRRQAERKSVSLPQLKKKMDAIPHSKRRSSLQNRLQISRSIQKNKMGNRCKQGSVRELEVGSQVLSKHRGCGGVDRKMMSRIKQKKLMARAKIK